MTLLSPNRTASALEYESSDTFKKFCCDYKSVHKSLLSNLSELRNKYEKQNRKPCLLDASAPSAEDKRASEAFKEEVFNRHTEMIDDLGALTLAIYEGELELSKQPNPPSKDSINTYVFEHTSKFQLVPAYKRSARNRPEQDLEFIFRPILNDENSDVRIFERPEFTCDKNTWLVGYDIETQSFDETAHFDLERRRTITNPPVTVSHQWYFNYQGIRFGIILLSDSRLYQEQFISFINRTLPETTSANCDFMKLIRVYAYFSVYESGWLLPSYRTDQKEFTFTNRLKLPAQMILERDDEWYGKVKIRAVEIPTLKQSGEYGKSKIRSVNLEFNDAIKLQSGGLKTLGKVIGIKKRDLFENAITRMAELVQIAPISFCDYAMTDSVIAAEAHLYIYHMQEKVVGGTVEKTRMPGYSVEHFKQKYIEHYPDKVEPGKRPLTHPKAWKEYLGYVNGEMTLTCNLFTEFYYGGRNDVLSVGPRDEAYYLDMHSAYLTSLTMLDDYNFSKGHVHTGAAAIKRAEELFDASIQSNNKGPFQVIGIECSFVFKKEHTTEAVIDATGEKITITRSVKPVFPVRINEAADLPAAYSDFATDGIIYPRCGSSCVTWPEFWVAKRMDLLESIHVIRVIEFDVVKDSTRVPTNWLAEDILGLLVKRKRAKDSKNEAVVAFLKSFLNFIYGKSVQGIAETSLAIKKHDLQRQVNKSAMTCFPLGSFITGFCRSVIAELIQLNPCYGVTTDGFITPTNRENLVVSELCTRVQKRLSEAGFNEKPAKMFIGCEYTAIQSLFIKTRGYMFIDKKRELKKGEVDDGSPFSPKEMLQKLARMGGPREEDTDIDPAKTFLEYLQTGYTDKKYFLKLKRVRVEQQKDENTVPSKRHIEDTAITMTYDMKHVPVNPQIGWFDWSGEAYPFVSFETEPIETANEFHVMRMLVSRDRDPDIEAYSDPSLLQKSYPIADPSRELQRMLDYWESTGLDTKLLQPYSYRLRKGKEVDIQIFQEQRDPKNRIFFSYKQDHERLAALLTDMREIPRYMVLEDYQRLLEDLKRYRNGQ